MGHHASHTPILIAALQESPGREFTASELEGRTRVPRKFVRRALTVDAEKVAQVPLDGVVVIKRDGLWRFSWGDSSRLP